MPMTVGQLRARTDRRCSALPPLVPNDASLPVSAPSHTREETEPELWAEAQQRRDRFRLRQRGAAERILQIEPARRRMAQVVHDVIPAAAAADVAAKVLDGRMLLDVDAQDVAALQRLEFLEKVSLLLEEIEGHRVISLPPP